MKKSHWFKFSLIAISSATLLACSHSKAPHLAAEIVVPEGHYRVRPGDTLYKISRQWGQSLNNLVRWNQIMNPNQITTGQILRVVPPKHERETVRLAPRPATSTPAPTMAQSGNLSLRWPVPNIARTQSRSTTHGLEIDMPKGTPIFAAASGTVAYSGDSIRQYGHLLILKHPNNYLTVYGNNQRLLVKEGAHVKAGDKIAESGASGLEQKEMLYFELRHSGKPINPLPHFTP